MTLQAKATEQLRADEGEVLHAYADHLGYWTIGIGRLIDVRKGGGISADESAYLLKNDIDKRIAKLIDVLPWFTRLDEARQGALLNMSFQLGMEGLLGFKNTLEMVRTGHYGKAGEAMMNSTWAKQTPRRALKVSTQMITGIWQ